MAGKTSSNPDDNLVGDDFNLQRSLVDIESSGLSNNSLAGNNDSAFSDNHSGLNGDASLLGSAVSAGGTGESVYEPVDLSASLRARLEAAESTVKKTLAIEEALKAEEVEEIELESDEMEDEMEDVRILSM